MPAKHLPDEVISCGVGEGQHKTKNCTQKVVVLMFSSEGTCFSSQNGYSAIKNISEGFKRIIYIYQDKINLDIAGYITVPSKRLEALQLCRKLILLSYHPNYQFIIFSASIQRWIFQSDKAYDNLKLGIGAIHM